MCSSQERYICIIEPQHGVAIDASLPIHVSGVGSGLFEGNVVLRVLDNRGEVLLEQPTTMPSAEVGGEGVWEINLQLPQGITSTQGIIYAFAPSAMDGTPDAADSVNVVLGEPPQGAWVNITNPMPYSELEELVFSVSGEGGMLFENSLVVQALDSRGDVVALQPVVIETEAGEMGAVGNWTITLTLPTAAITSGYLEAYHASPKDGSKIASFIIPVTFQIEGSAQPTMGLDDTTWVLRYYGNPKDPTPVLKGTFVAADFYPQTGEVSGMAGCNNYFASYAVEGERLTISLAAVAGMEKLCSDPAGVMKQEAAFLEALASARSFRIEKGNLYITYEDGELVFMPVVRQSGLFLLISSKRVPGVPHTGHFSGAPRSWVYPQTGQT
jgi:heat shock protein HslJ